GIDPGKGDTVKFFDSFKIRNGQPGVQPRGGGNAAAGNPPKEPAHPATNSPYKISPKATYLTDMQEFDVQVGPWPLGKHGNVGDQKKKIVVKGRRSTKGLGLHVPNVGQDARLRYRLNKKAQVFKALGAFNDAPGEPGPGPVRFVVLGDGKELWKSQVLRERGQAESCV